MFNMFVNMFWSAEGFVNKGVQFDFGSLKKFGLILTLSKKKSNKAISAKLLVKNSKNKLE